MNTILYTQMNYIIVNINTKIESFELKKYFYHYFNLVLNFSKQPIKRPLQNNAFKIIFLKQKISCIKQSLQLISPKKSATNNITNLSTKLIRHPKSLNLRRSQSPSTISTIRPSPSSATPTSIDVQLQQATVGVACQPRAGRGRRRLSANATGCSGRSSNGRQHQHHHHHHGSHGVPRWPSRPGRACGLV